MNMDVLLGEKSRIAIAATAVATYGIFKRYEPETPLPLGLLLGAVPGVLSLGICQFSTNNPLYAIATTYGSFYTILVLCILIYRVSPFHSLDRYPGPFLHRLSKFRMAWILYQRKEHLGVDITYFQKLHQKYGPYVRTGPNELSICDAEAIFPVLGATGFPKGPFWDGRVAPGVTRSLISERDPVEHLRRRKPWNRGFSTSALQGYEEILRSRTIQFVATLENMKGVVDLDEWLSYYTFDFMGDMAFGGGFEMMREGKDHTGVIELMDNSFVKSNITAHVPYMLRYLNMLPAPIPSTKFRDFAANRVAIRQKNGTLRKDLFHYLIDEEGLEPHPPPMQELMSDGLLAIVAGSDTTAHVLVNLFRLLMQHPDCYARLQAEIDEAFPPGAPAHDLSKCRDMHYLEAVIHESMRLQPPVPNGAQRSTQRIGARMVGSQYIPAGTQVQINTYALHRDPKYFYPFPEEFWPDRWLDPEERIPKGTDKGFVHDTRAFFPFSFGPAMCVGRPLAYMQLQCDERHLEAYAMAGRGSLPINITVRE